jgi:hypothetical protein
VTIRWTSDRKYLSEAHGHRTALRQRWWRLADALERQGALEVGESRAIRPRIEVTVSDRRRRKAGALPTLPPDAGDVAWTARKAGLAGDPAAAESLIELLYRPDGPDETLVRRAVLDALIRLDVKVAAEHLLPDLDGETRDLALVLLSRAPRDNRDLLLRLFDAWLPDPAPNGGVTWIDARLDVVAHLLARQRARGFAERLLALGPPAMTIYLVDPGEASVPTEPHTDDGRDTSPPPPLVPAGFPPCVHYELEFRGAGPDHRRVETSRVSQRPRGQRRSLLARRAHWIAAMTRLPLDVQDALYTMKLEVCEGALDPARVAAARDDVLRAYWSLVRRLVELDLLPLREAKGLDSTVRIVIDDWRADAPTLEVAVPELPPSAVDPGLPED